VVWNEQVIALGEILRNNGLEEKFEKFGMLK
jgi:hypothetical protein